MMEMKEVPGGSKPLRRWEYYYWGLGATGISYFLYNRLKEPEKTPEEIEVLMPVLLYELICWLGTV